MRFEFFVARRYLFSRALISIASGLAVIGVAIGVAALIVVLGVMNGLITDMRDKLIGATAHAIVFSAAGMDQRSSSLPGEIEGMPGVTAATPFIYGELVVSSSSGGKGTIVRGIDPATAPKVLGVLARVTEGSVQALSEPAPLPGIVVGGELARKLGLYVGGRVNMLAPSGQQSAAGFTPKIRPFRVVGIFSSGMFEQDFNLCFISLAAARELLGLPEGRITGIQIAVEDPFEAQTVADQVVKQLGPPYYAQTWMSLNANFFAALQLEKIGMSIILTLIILVGAFSIITALVMVVMEKTRDIAILMSMGATRENIRRIFIIQGTAIGAIGTVAGYALGLTLCLLLKKYKFIELPHGIYSLDYLPVLLQWPDLILTGTGAMLLCFLATLYPSYKAASLEPVEALRQE